MVKDRLILIKEKVVGFFAEPFRMYKSTPNVMNDAMFESPIVSFMAYLCAYFLIAMSIVTGAYVFAVLLSVGLSFIQMRTLIRKNFYYIAYKLKPFSNDTAKNESKSDT